MGFPSPIAPVKNNGQETIFSLNILRGSYLQGWTVRFEGGPKEGSHPIFRWLRFDENDDFCAASQCSMHCINPCARPKITTETSVIKFLFCGFWCAIIFNSYQYHSYPHLYSHPDSVVTFSSPPAHRLKAKHLEVMKTLKGQTFSIGLGVPADSFHRFCLFVLFHGYFCWLMNVGVVCKM